MKRFPDYFWVNFRRDFDRHRHQWSDVFHRHQSVLNDRTVYWSSFTSRIPMFPWRILLWRANGCSLRQGYARMSNIQQPLPIRRDGLWSTKWVALSVTSIDGLNSFGIRFRLVRCLPWRLRQPGLSEAVASLQLLIYTSSVCFQFRHNFEIFFPLSIFSIILLNASDVYSFNSIKNRSKEGTPAFIHFGKKLNGAKPKLETIQMFEISFSARCADEGNKHMHTGVEQEYWKRTLYNSMRRRLCWRVIVHI